MRREVSSFNVRSANLDELGRFPAVTTEERHGDSQLLGLLYDQPDIRVVTRDNDRVGIGRFDGRELALEIFVAAIVSLLGHNRAAAGGEGRLEVTGQSHAIIGFNVSHDGDLHGFERALGEIGQQFSLELVRETNAENIVAHLGEFNVRGRRRNHRDLVLLTDGRGFHGPRGGYLAQHSHNAVPGNEFLDDGGRFAGLGLVILIDQLDFFPEYSARRVDFLDGQLRSVMRHLAERGFLAG